MDDKKLTDKQEMFCKEYLIDLNATQSAIRAGYSEDSAQQIGSENMLKLVIKRRIEELMDERSAKLQITSEWVLKRFKDISDRCMTAEPVLIKDHEGNWIESGEYKFDSNGANKATENIGKHIGFFEKDNQQKTNDPLKVEIVPPIKE